MREVFQPERVTEDHRKEGFRCGHPSLDDWLQRSALTADRKGTSRVYVWARPDRSVAGYFAVAPHVIERAALPRPIGRGDPDVIPAVLIAKLALDQGLHGQGLGTNLLVDALVVVTSAATRVGGRYIVVDAIDVAAAAFYRRHGFTAIGDTSRLILPVKNAMATLAHTGRLNGETDGGAG
jgi:GNAT superfamily N-acetyltransferase